MTNRRKWINIALIITVVATLFAVPVISGAATANGITSPKEGATAKGSVEVMGVAADPNFMKWQLDVLPGGDANKAIFIALGDKPAAEPTLLATIDTTKFPDGEHALRLRVVRNDSNYDEYSPSSPSPTLAPRSHATATVRNATVAATAAVTATVAAGTTAPVAAATPAAPASKNGITSPKEGATAKGSVEVKGVAADPNFMKWQLDILPGGDANKAIFIALGTKAATEPTLLATIDTTKFPDGEHALRLRVVRNDSNYDEYVTKFTLANAGAPAATPATTVAATPTVAATAAATATVTATATTAPVAGATPAAPASKNGITSPKEGATVKGSAEVKGVATDPNFMKWQLDVLPGGDANKAIFIALGDKPATEPTLLAAIDTTKFPDGEHALRLRVVRNDSNYDEYLTKFTIANAAAK